MDIIHLYLSIKASDKNNNDIEKEIDLYNIEKAKQYLSAKSKHIKYDTYGKNIPESDIVSTVKTHVSVRSMDVNKIYRMGLERLITSIAPAYKTKSINLVLDLFLSRKTADRPTRYSYDIHDRNIQYQSDRIITQSAIKNIIGIRFKSGTYMYRFQNSYSASPSYATSGGFPLPIPTTNGLITPFQNNFAIPANYVYIGIEEFNQQSFIDVNNFKYHFIGFLNRVSGISSGRDHGIVDISDSASGQGTSIGAINTLSENKGYFWFNNPVREITTITLQLRNPDSEINVFQEINRNVLYMEFIYIDDESYMKQ
jgi:hypothetical protein